MKKLRPHFLNHGKSKKIKKTKIGGHPVYDDAMHSQKKANKIQ